MMRHDSFSYINRNFLYCLLLFSSFQLHILSSILLPILCSMSFAVLFDILFTIMLLMLVLIKDPFMGLETHTQSQEVLFSDPFLVLREVAKKC